MNVAQTVSAPVTSDRRVRSFSAIPSPHEVLTELPLGARRAERVARDRDEVADILAGRDDRLLVVVGPCSVHDPAAALEYASRLAKIAAELGDRLKIVMRVYFEKPRTTVGWKGLINDPGMDGTFDVARGLRVARQLLLDVIDIGLPVGCEFLSRPARSTSPTRSRGGDRRPHHRIPGAPAAGVRVVDAGRGSRTAPTATSRSPSTARRPPGPPTFSSAWTTWGGARW